MGVKRRGVNTYLVKIRVEKGEQGRVYPNPSEEPCDVNKPGIVTGPGGKRVAPDLSCFEWIKILDKNTGKLRTVRGELTVFLGPHEEFVGTKQKCIDINEETAVLIRNKRTGTQKLITQHQAFAPDDDEEVCYGDEGGRSKFALITRNYPGHRIPVTSNHRIFPSVTDAV